jgi:hypothetical protein
MQGVQVATSTLNTDILWLADLTPISPRRKKKLKNGWKTVTEVSGQRDSNANFTLIPVAWNMRL